MFKKLGAMITAAAMTATLSIATTPGVAHADRTCTGRLVNTRVNDNIRVPSGARCVLVGTYVDGNITTGKNATLSIDRSTIKGNVEGFDHHYLTVANSKVDGNIIADDGFVSWIRGNDVDGNIEVFDNSNTQRIFRNTVDGNLTCSGNRGVLTGQYNTVRGDKENQCRNLRVATIMYPKKSGMLVSGTLKHYNTWGSLINYRGMTVQIQVNDGGRWVTTNRPVTNSNGFFAANVPSRHKGKQVRVWFQSPYSHVIGSIKNVGTL